MDIKDFLQRQREKGRRLRAAIRPDDLIREIASDSGIPLDSDLYREIAIALTALGVNLSFFTFETGKHRARPLLNIYLPHDADFRATGVSHHSNNGSDVWPLTKTVREALNGILRSHGCGADYISDSALIYLRTLEEEIRNNLGCVCKDALRRAIQEHAPGVQIDRFIETDRLFWTGEAYYVTFRDTADWKRAEQAKDRILNDLERAFAAADIGKACQSYEVEVDFSDPKGAVSAIDRDDICADW